MTNAPPLLQLCHDYCRVHRVDADDMQVEGALVVDVCVCVCVSVHSGGG